VSIDIPILILILKLDKDLSTGFIFSKTSHRQCLEDISDEELIIWMSTNVKSLPDSMFMKFSRYVIPGRRFYAPVGYYFWITSFSCSTRKKKKKKKKKGFSPEEADKDEEACDREESVLCEHQDAWGVEGLSLVAAYSGDIRRSGGLLPTLQSAIGEKTFQFQTNFQIDLFFRLRAYGKLEAIRPRDHELHLHGKEAFVWPPFGPKIPPVKPCSHPVPVPLKRPASFQTSLPTFEDNVPELAFDTQQGTSFWASRGLEPKDFFQLDLIDSLKIKEIQIFTGSRKQVNS